MGIGKAIDFEKEISRQKEQEDKAIALTSGFFLVATLAAFGVLAAKILVGAPLM